MDYIIFRIGFERAVPHLWIISVRKSYYSAIGGFWIFLEKVPTWIGEALESWLAEELTFHNTYDCVCSQ